ncbi:AraC-type DNA-binding protein [Rhizobium aethiopicum]|uniref:AraC-type DNA-binding protein n=2 Tax=Rhizobium/Agrobacterium group TaxID=227290 RepID=A0A1C3Y303_9HYPH|nr:AraC family transcriptional regulator [Rhizobium aethiopicum]SCB58842.1 AraC-type DNA-binding protein [Rhizobium aethiopicum]
MTQNYFLYLPDNRLCSAWGCTAVSTGHTKILPHSVYPPMRHPDDHHFDWKRGRILQAYQVILIAEGRGLFEFGRRGKTQRVEAGSIVLLFPGVWHRFAPDPELGWTENWIECRSTAFDFARTAGLIDPTRSVLPSTPEVGAVFERIHGLAVDDGLANQPLLSTLGLQLLALLSQQKELTSAAPADRLVERARMLLMERCTQRISVEDVAGELGVSYSYFRRVFRDKTGVSPKQHLVSLRIRRAQDIFANTDKPIKEVAGLLGFSSAFHLSSQFQHLVGCSPSEYKRRSIGAE